MCHYKNICTQSCATLKRQFHKIFPIFSFINQNSEPDCPETPPPYTPLPPTRAFRSAPTTYGRQSPNLTYVDPQLIARPNSPLSAQIHVFSAAYQLHAMGSGLAVSRPTYLIRTDTIVFTLGTRGPQTAHVPPFLPFFVVFFRIFFQRKRCSCKSSG